MKKNEELTRIVQYITTHPHMDLNEGCELIVNWANAQNAQPVEVGVQKADYISLRDPVEESVPPTMTPPAPVVEEVKTEETPKEYSKITDVLVAGPAESEKVEPVHTERSSKPVKNTPASKRVN